MEQKQLDEIDESYFGEEFIDDEEFDILEEVKTDKSKITNYADDEIKIEAVTLKKKIDKAAKKKITRKNSEKTMDKNDSDNTIKTAASNNHSNNSKDNYKKASAVRADPFVETRNVEARNFETKKEIPVKEVKQADFRPEAKTLSEKTAHHESVKKPVETAPKFDPWDDQEESSGFFKETSTWKAITGIILVLLVFSVFTQGFRFAEDQQYLTGAAISIIDAEQMATKYVNSYLLQPPFYAEVVNREDTGEFYKFTFSVAGDLFESYVTKNGEMLFPQGFNTAKTPEEQLPYAASAEEPAEEFTEVNEESDSEGEIQEQTTEDQVTVEPETTVTATEETAASGSVHEETITAKKWLFSPHIINVNQGEIVKLTIVPQDMELTFAIPTLNIIKEVSESTTVEFTATTKGSYGFTCKSCDDFRGMTGIVVVK